MDKVKELKDALEAIAIEITLDLAEADKEGNEYQKIALKEAERAIAIVRGYYDLKTK